MSKDAEHNWDLIIVGAGAAGLMAAIHAGRTARDRGFSLRIAAMDGAAKLGTKILVAGGGRCNVTHDVVHAEDYAGGSRNQIKKVLRSFSVEQTVAFFAELGVELKREETGKLFPTTDRARTVLEAILAAAREVNVSLLTEHRVHRIERMDDGRYHLRTSQGAFEADRLIMATGGKALPRTGSDGGGYRLLEALGHTITRTTPGLVPLLLPADHWLTDLSGVTVEAELALHHSSGKVLHRQAGSLLMTHFGLSGPAAMDISRHWLWQRLEDPSCSLKASFLPGRSFAQVEQLFLQATGGSTIGSLLRPFLPARLAEALAERIAAASVSQPVAQLARDARRNLIHALVSLPLPVTGDRGYTHAEVTAGGVPLEEVELATMASRRAAGLYLCGEILNVDGRIGGYNFQWAWCTGRLAGLAAASSFTSGEGPTP